MKRRLAWLSAPIAVLIVIIVTGAIVLGAPDRDTDRPLGTRAERLGELPQPAARARLASWYRAPEPEQWTAQLGDPSGSRYSPLAEITAANVTSLEVAFTFDPHNERGHEAAPLVVGDTMYVTTPYPNDVYALDLPDDSFDVVHAHQVLQHVPDPVGALREMLRVTRSGGLVAVRDSDYGHFSWHPASSGLDRWLELYDAAARANGGEPHAGRMLLAWAHAAGATDVVAGSSTWCYADAADREWWGALWADRITSTALAHQLVAEGRATADELAEVAAAWRAWAADADGWFSVLHGEVLVRA